MDKKNTSEKPFKNTTSKKGFLKQKGYKPVHSQEHGPSQRETGEEDNKYLGNLAVDISKATRPEQFGPKQEEKKQKRPKQSMAKDPKYQRVNMLRYTLTILGVFFLLISIIISYQNYLKMTDEAESLKGSGYNLMIELRNYEELQHGHEHSSKAWEGDKYLQLQTETITADLKPGVEYLIEVYDLSTYPIKYNRTIENGLAWSTVELSKVKERTANDKFIISSIVNIYITSEEVHLAKIYVTVWK